MSFKFKVGDKVEVVGDTSVCSAMVEEGDVGTVIWIDTEDFDHNTDDPCYGVDFGGTRNWYFLESRGLLELID